MHDTSTGIMGRIRQQRHLRQWTRLANLASTAGEDKLRKLKRLSVEFGESISAVNNTAEARLAEITAQGALPDVPPSTDWWHRTQAIAGKIHWAGAAPAKSETRIGDDLTLYHDATTPSLALRQFRQTCGKSGAPFGLKLDVFDFDGGFLSLVIQAPISATKGLLKSQLLRLHLGILSERPIEISARLNLKHGPNTEQVSHDITCSPEGTTQDFDLAYMPFTEGRAEQIWVDIFFQTPPMNLITITEMTLSRHRRAEL